MRLSEMAGGKKVRGAGGVHALLPHHLRRAVAARARHLPALPPADGMKFIFVGGGGLATVADSTIASGGRCTRGAISSGGCCMRGGCGADPRMTGQMTAGSTG